MKMPVKLSFRNFKPTFWIEELVQEQASKLERYARHIQGCLVVVETPHNHSGDYIKVRIEITVAERKIYVSQGASETAPANDMYAVMNDAFSSALKQLEDYVMVREGVLIS